MLKKSNYPIIMTPYSIFQVLPDLEACGCQITKVYNLIHLISNFVTFCPKSFQGKTVNLADIILTSANLWGRLVLGYSM